MTESKSNMINDAESVYYTDGQFRYKTKDELSSSKYPRPKTLFTVFFKGNDILNTKDCIELSKFVMSVDKPNISYTTKQMNQYNRIRYIYENIKYGNLKITFIDVKDSPIQQKFFKYLKENNYDIDYSNTNNWGLNINSNKKIFDRIIIEEKYLNSYMSYYVINPVLKDISFGTNKMGDYEYNEIVVTFDVESVSNIVYGHSSLTDNQKINNEIDQIYKNRVNDISTKYSTKFFEKLNLQ